MCPPVLPINSKTWVEEARDDPAAAQALMDFMIDPRLMQETDEDGEFMRGFREKLAMQEAGYKAIAMAASGRGPFYVAGWKNQPPEWVKQWTNDRHPGVTFFRDRDGGVIEVEIKERSSIRMTKGERSYLVLYPTSFLERYLRAALQSVRS